MDQEVPEDQIAAALAALDAALGRRAVLAVYLYGSAVGGGLRPDSDLDLLVVAARRSSADEKRRLVELLLPISGRETRPLSWRPLELTIVVRSEVRPWRYPPRCDFQYGEWLRGDFLGGQLTPYPAVNPDLAVLITVVRGDARVLRGPEPRELFEPVPRRDLIRAMLDGLDALLADLESDTRNVLLTLARIWCTAATGEIRSKDAAADWALPRMAEEHRPVLATARDLYRAGGYGEWRDSGSVRAAADSIVQEVTGRYGPSGPLGSVQVARSRDTPDRETSGRTDLP